MASTGNCLSKIVNWNLLKFTIIGDNCVKMGYIMKKSIQLGLAMVACFVSSQSFATMQSINVPTTCYLFKNNKLASQSKCLNVHSEGFASITALMTQDEYQISGKKPIIYFFSDDIQSSDKSVQKLNGIPAINQYRDAKTFRVLGEGQNTKTSLYCHKQKTGNLEICTPDLDTSSDRELGDLSSYGK